MTLSVNPLGCSPRAIQALKRCDMNDVATYPDIRPLILATSNRFSIKPSCVLVGNGSEQIIKLITQTFLSSKSTALVQSGSFSLFSKECMLAGATVKLCTINAMEAQTSKPNLLFLCSPNNPTGEVISQRTIKRIIATFPKAIIVIDEANAEFSNETTIPTAIRKRNVLVLRTCSKALGLAGLRVGFLVGNETFIKKLTETQQVFPISSISAKVAIAAMNDTTFLKRTKTFITKERTLLTNALKKRGLNVSASVTNTLFVSTPRAKRLITVLNNTGVSVISNTFSPGLTTPGFRIALRDRKTNRQFLQKLDAAIEQIGLNLIR